MISQHSGRIADIAQNSCRYRVLQKALDCKEEEVCLLTGSELLQVDPATTLVNKHASHVSNKVRVVLYLGKSKMRIDVDSRVDSGIDSGIDF
jgi:hypothetical protein